MSTRLLAEKSGPKHQDETRPVVYSNGNLTGLGTLLRFMLRRDRWRLPLWVVGLSAMTAYFANAIGIVMDSASLQSMTIFAKNPIMGLISGPGYGFDDITLAKFIVGMYGVFLMLGAALMSITTIARHTRVEEQTGRAELIRADVTGRHTQLIAALLLTLLMNVLVTGLMSVFFFYSEANPKPYSSALLFAASVGAVGCVFAAVTAVTCQFSSNPRAGTGIAGAILGITFVVRGLGDMSAVAGGDLDWLSWLSPLGWAQQTAPFTLDRWWPLLYSIALVVLLIPIALFLQSKRDLGAGILPDRLGKASAAHSLSTPLGLAFRLQRSGLIWWSIGVLVMGITFGSFAEALREGASGMPQAILDLMGGAGGIVDGYVGYMGLYFAMIVTAYAILASSGLRSEEQGVRTEPVLATAVSRLNWQFSWSLIVLLGGLWLMFLAGIGEGLGAASTTNNWDLFAEAIAGHTAQAASVWVFLGLSMAIYGWVPRLMGLTWVVFVYSAVMALFGQMLQLDESVLDTSLFRHIGQYPAQDLSAEAILTLAGASAVLLVIGLIGFRRRDLITA